MLLVFSDPSCGPCNQLVSQLERLQQRSAELQILVVSRGDLEANRAKVAEHGLTFPVVVQRKWEISREYGIFATPVGYLIDEAGIIEQDVVVGAEAILSLVVGRERIMRERMQARLEVLREEFEAGEVELAQVEKQRAYLRDTMLRIGGAIQVLEEVLGEDQLTEQRNGSSATGTNLGPARAGEAKEST